MEDAGTFTFSEAPDKLRKLFPRGMPETARVTRHIYKNAEKIKFNQSGGAPPTLYIVESGLAEIYQTSTCLGNFHAYRPIKIFRAGHPFGLFSLADAITGRRGPSRPKEDWAVRAGKVSTLVLGCVDNGYCASRRSSAVDGEGNSDEPFRPHHLLQAQRQDEQTAILRVELPDATSLKANHDELASKIVEMSWIDVLEYRLGKNLYNVSHYLGTRAAVYRHDEYKQIAEKHHIQVRKFKYKLLDYFIDAVVDALDRPTYDAPMFYNAGLSGTIPYSDRNHNLMSLDLSWVYEADHISQLDGQPFFYPVGLLNFDLNCHLARTKEDRGDMIAALAPRILHERPDGGWFLKDLFSIIKQVYFERHSQEFADNYEYDVELTTSNVSEWNYEGGTSACKALLLKFTRR